MHRRRILSAPISLDLYLTSIGRRYPTDRFLASATQGCYVCQVTLLVAMFGAQGRSPQNVGVLDWGAGKGHISYLLKEAGFQVVSCDVLAKSGDSTFGQLTPIIAEQGLSVVPLDHAWQLPFRSAELDLVVSFGVLEHVPCEQDSLREIARVLKPGGFLFFSFLPSWLSWTQRLTHLRGDYYYPRLYRTRSLGQLLGTAGLGLADAWHGSYSPRIHCPQATGWSG